MDLRLSCLVLPNYIRHHAVKKVLPSNECLRRPNIRHMSYYLCQNLHFRHMSLYTCVETSIPEKIFLPPWLCNVLSKCVLFFFSAWSIAILGVSLGNSFLTDAELVDLSNVQHIQFIWRFFHDAERPNPVLLLCVNWIYGVCWVYKFEIEAYKVCSHSLAFVRLLNSFYWHSISLLVNH